MEDTAMIKKDYQKPTIRLMQSRHQKHLLTISDTRATGLGGNNLGYGKDGGDQENAW